MTLLHPTSELVALAWIQAATGIACGIDLPEQNSTWSTNGFITTLATGGTPQIHLPQRESVISVDCWAVLTDSPRPPWLQAAQLAETVYAATIPTSAKRQVDPNTIAAPSGGNTYAHAHVQTIYALTEPRPVLGDPAGYAHYQFDALIRWVAAAL